MSEALTSPSLVPEGSWAIFRSRDPEVEPRVKEVEHVRWLFGKIQCAVSGVVIPWGPQLPRDVIIRQGFSDMWHALAPVLNICRFAMQSPHPGKLGFNFM